MITVDLKHLNFQPGYKILDIGSGTGRHIGAISRYKNVTVIGADLSFLDTKEARARLNFIEACNECHGRWGLLVSSINRLPFSDQSFDVVLCTEVLEHLENDQEAVAELVRVLKPTGNIVISVPRYWPERICWFLSKAYHNMANGHLRIYKRHQLIALLERYDLRLWRVHYAHSLHVPFWWLKCLVGIENGTFPLVVLYHQFLVWDIMKQPKITRFIDKLLNPVLGKSMILYSKKRLNKCDNKLLT